MMHLSYIARELKKGAGTAIHSMSVIMFAEAAKEIFAHAVDLVVQVGWQKRKRKILGL